MVNITSALSLLAAELLFFSGSPLIMYHGKSAANATLIDQLQQISRPLPAFCFLNISEPADLDKLVDRESILKNAVILELDFEPRRKISEELIALVKRLHDKMSILTIIHTWHRECNMSELLLENRLDEVGELCEDRLRKIEATGDMPSLNVLGFDMSLTSMDSKLLDLLNSSYPKDCRTMCSSIDPQDELATCVHCQNCRAEKMQEHLDWMKQEDRRQYLKKLCQFEDGRFFDSRKIQEVLQEYGYLFTLLGSLLVVICPIRDAARDVTLAFFAQWVREIHKPAACVAFTIQVHLLLAVSVIRDHREPLRRQRYLDLARWSKIFFGIVTAMIVAYRLRSAFDLDFEPFEICTRTNDRFYYSIQIMLAVAQSLVLNSLEYLHYRRAESFWKKLSFSLFILTLQVILVRVGSSWMDPIMLVLAIPLVSKLILGLYLPFVTMYSSHSDAQVQVGLMESENLDVSCVDHQEALKLTD